jgi:hypothetical protein
MILVERLRLTVPARFAERADRIAWLAADELARADTEVTADLDRIVVPPVAVSAGAPDEEIAARLVEAVRSQLGSREAAAR